MASKISPTAEYAGVPMNGEVQMNGVPMNGGYPMNGVPMNVAYPNGVPMNGGYAMNGVPLATAGVMMVPMSQPIQAYPNSSYGNHIAIQTASYGEIKLLYKAEYEYYMCTCCSNPFLASCCIDKTRTYFHIYENSYEYNNPFLVMQCCSLIGTDTIRKAYFDRGIFDQQGCMRAVGCIRGTPTVHAGNTQFVCFCQDCPPCGNDYLNGYWPNLCGERVRYSPADTVCCCCPTRACCLNNYCGLCGPKDGEPLILFPFVSSLRHGTADQFVAQIESARSNWISRTGLK